MASLHDKLISAWRDAAADLQIRVTAPFVADWTEAEPLRFAALVHDFGGPRGILVDTCEHIAAVRHAIPALPGGFGYSGLNEVYAPYQRDRFINALEDWGWRAAAAPPDWYRGHPEPDAD